jgi:hypothetical protein
MPVDAHYAFAGLTEEDLQKLFPKARLTISDAQYNSRIQQLAAYFEGMTEDQLKALVPKTSVVMNDDQYTNFINQYLNDGKPAPANDESPNRIWKKVSFVKPHRMVVDAGAAAAAEDAPLSAFEGKNFDPAGLAVNQLLKQGEPTEFEPGDEAVFDPPTADNLVNAGVAKVKENVYVRPLRDYKSFFDDSFRQEIKFQDAATVIKEDTQTLAAARARVLAQLTYRDDELLKLQHDRDGFAKELAAVTSVLAKFEAERKRLLADNSELYRANLAYADKIRQEQLRQAAEIYRRGSAPPAASETLPAPTTPDPTSGAVTAP